MKPTLKILFRAALLLQLAAQLTPLPARAARPQKLFSCQASSHGMSAMVKWYDDGKGTLLLDRNGKSRKTCDLSFGSYDFSMETEGPLMSVSAERGECDPKLSLREKLEISKNLRIKLRKIGPSPDAHATLDWHVGGASRCKIIFYDEAAVTQAVKRWSGTE